MKIEIQIEDRDPLVSGNPLVEPMLRELLIDGTINAEMDDESGFRSIDWNAIISDSFTNGRTIVVPTLNQKNYLCNRIKKVYRKQLEANLDPDEIPDDIDYMPVWTMETEGKHYIRPRFPEETLSPFRFVPRKSIDGNPSPRNKYGDYSLQLAVLGCTWLSLKHYGFKKSSDEDKKKLHYFVGMLAKSFSHHYGMYTRYHGDDGKVLHITHDFHPDKRGLARIYFSDLSRVRSQIKMNAKSADYPDPIYLLKDYNIKVLAK